MFISCSARQSKCPPHLFDLIHDPQNDLGLSASAPAGPDLFHPISPCFIPNTNQSFEECVRHELVLPPPHIHNSACTWHTQSRVHTLISREYQHPRRAYHGELIQYPFACFKCHSLSSSGVTCSSWWQ